MHELSVIYPIIQMVERIAKENGVEQITAVRLLVGELHDMDEKWMNHYYKRFTSGTTLEGSELQLHRVPMRFRCKSCSAEQTYTHFSFAGVDLKCETCGCLEMEMLSGRELEIEEVEFVDPEKVKQENSE